MYAFSPFKYHQFPSSQTGYIFGSCLKHVIGGKIGGTERRKERRKQLLDDLKQTMRYCKVKEKILVALCGKLALEEAMDLS
jgi:hypothetical protein